MKIREEDPIMNEVYATRHKISACFENNPKRYIESIREMNRNAAAAGMSFLAYCQSIVGTESMFPMS